jgi:hypothetical protein
MKRHLLLYGLCLVGFLGPVLAAAEWTSKRDNKPLFRLKTMPEEELLREAAQVCQVLQRSLTGANPAALQQREEAAEYLLLLALIVRDKATPFDPSPWVRHVMAARAEPSPTLTACPSIYQEAR